MADEISINSASESLHNDTQSRRLVPMQVGNATVYVKQIGEPVIDSDDRIYPVALPSPSQAFAAALEVVRECVSGLGEQIEKLRGKMRPDKLTVEFSITLDVKGKSSLIPVLITSELEAATGLKVTAVWDQPQTDKS